jgi:hypothetical protein
MSNRNQELKFLDYGVKVHTSAIKVKVQQRLL